MKRIVLITSGQPTLNPRLVKEADALIEDGFEVIVLYQYLSEWATLADETLIKSRKWSAVRVGGSPNQSKLIYNFSRILNKIGQLSYRLFPNNLLVNYLMLNRNSLNLIKTAKSIKADLYIAHNLAALPAAILAAKTHGRKAGFDAEDFHRQEVTDDTNDSDYKVKKYIEDKFLNRTNYFTAASPLIGQEYKKLYPNLHPVVIHNVFNIQEINKHPNSRSSKLKLFWFSQTIGKNRGIEDVIYALNELNNQHIELYLLGNVNAEIRDYFHSISIGKINFLDPVPSDEVFQIASTFDIGLALEQSTPWNRDICLTNKIFTYMSSRLALIGTDTSAQIAFFNTNPKIGQTYKQGDSASLAKSIAYYYNNREALDEAKQNSYELATKKYNWSIEKKVFLNLVHNNIN